MVATRVAPIDTRSILVYTVSMLETLKVLEALADPTRFEICKRLSAEELCVCHLVDDLEISQPLLSHHMKVLKEAGLVESRRFSYWTYYRLQPEGFQAVAKDVASLADAACCQPEARACC